MAGSSIILTTAKPGSGKSYRRCAGAIPEILDDGFERHISNFPVRFDDNSDGEGMRAACIRLVRIREDGEDGKAKFRAITGEEVESKILRIPQEVLDSWAVHQPGSSEVGDGPWNHFSGENAKLLDRAHIALDEAQLFIPKTGCQAAKKQAWASWLSEIRHRGARIEFITQDPVLLADEITKLAAIRIEIFTRDDEWVPYIGCHFRALRYFVCKALRKRIIIAAEVEYSGSTHGKWDETRRFGFWITGALFGRYDSHSKPKTGEAGKEVDEPWQRYGWLGLIAWFFRQYFIYQVRNLAVVAVGVWLLFFGGFGQCLSFGISTLTKATHVMVNGQKDLIKPGDKGEAKSGAGEGGDGKPAATIAGGGSVPPRSGADGNSAGGVDVLRVAGLTPRVVYFDKLGWFEIGEAINGPDDIDGPRVESIDFRRSIVALSDGRRLRMFAAGGAIGAQGGVSGSLPSGGGGASQGAELGGGGDGAASDVERGRDEPRRPSPVAGSGAWGVDHMRGQYASPVRND